MRIVTGLLGFAAVALVTACGEAAPTPTPAQVDAGFSLVVARGTVLPTPMLSAAFVDAGQPPRGRLGRSGVMMQGFYWDVPRGGTWYDVMRSKAAELGDMGHGYGIDLMWFPPPSKAASGGYSMGYDPYDYFDLGELDQKGSRETRFGSADELRAAIAAFADAGVRSMADIVLNHRSGGAAEDNPRAGRRTYTDFSRVLSGRAAWRWDSFHPNEQEDADNGSFGGMPDVAYRNAPPFDDMKAWLRWLQDPAHAGFSAWRFDYVKGVWPWVVKAMKAASGNAFSVGEYWDANTDTLAWWAREANASAFDFALYYTMRDVLNDTGGGGWLPSFVDPAKSFAAKEPGLAVTFAGNHDTDEIHHDKALAYAFMLTYQGFPCIWWKDWFDYGLAEAGGKPGNGLKRLVWVRGRLAGGAPDIELLKTDDGDLLVYGALGWSNETPGYVVVINDSTGGWRGARVRTGNQHLRGKTLSAYAWYSNRPERNNAPSDEPCSEAGDVEVWAPPRGYAVYSVKGL